MNIFDAVIIGITLILGIKGFFNGIIKEISGLIGIIGGLIAASKYHHQAGNYINSYIFKIPNPSAIDLVGFIAVFVGVWLFIVFIGFLFSKILKISALGGIDKILGFLFGSLKFFLLISVIIVLLYQVAFIREYAKKYVQNSFMFPVMLKVGDKIMNITSKDLEKLSKNAKILN
ncbi:MAG: CvpA family protein [Nautiliaceae bacterium]